MSATGRAAPAPSATADRDLQVVHAPRELVFEAFTEVRHLSPWLGGVHHHNASVGDPRRPRVWTS